jgi:hypothetical protein
MQTFCASRTSTVIVCLENGHALRSLRDTARHLLAWLLSWHACMTVASEASFLSSLHNSRLTRHIFDRAYFGHRPLEHMSRRTRPVARVRCWSLLQRRQLSRSRELLQHHSPTSVTVIKFPNLNSRYISYVSKAFIYILSTIFQSAEQPHSSPCSIPA